MKSLCFKYYVMYLLMTMSIVCAKDFHEYQAIECTIVPIRREEKNFSHPFIPGPKSSRVPSNQTSSTNWSGYVAQTNLSHSIKNSVSAVSASWIVPTIKTSANGASSSVWVGIDGYSSSSVEQIGTDHDWSNGAQQHYAWFEMYPAGSYAINGFPVNPGDVISASVTYIGNKTFVMTIINDTKKVTFTVPTSYTKSSTALRNCAEWVIEAPYLNTILPLSNFGTIYMWGCMATINGINGPIGNSAWQNIGIEMVTNSGAVKDLVSALLPDKGSFFTIWQHQ